MFFPNKLLFEVTKTFKGVVRSTDGIRSTVAL